MKIFHITTRFGTLRLLLMSIWWKRNAIFLSKLTSSTLDHELTNHLVLLQWVSAGCLAIVMRGQSEVTSFNQEIIPHINPLKPQQVIQTWEWCQSSCLTRGKQNKLAYFQKWLAIALITFVSWQPPTPYEVIKHNRSKWHRNASMSTHKLCCICNVNWTFTDTWSDKHSWTPLPLNLKK